ncbi:uncharacterized protein [Spinacia oleracea]|uniref:Reverse transcriptase zinc-binding domain-containing protein n=1 Tax=Spinacia oleracea TaxID=3562 RepID=A0ABM3QY27_SPIOL|nr:uncharacterized protein LOC130463205 [Spinacia oleracea]
MVEASGFVRSVLPFKYLGVPICSKKISAGKCDVLVDKMTARIKMWSTRNLSYTARMQLINSVLLSLHMYWAQVYILPKSVLLDITRICRAFLWSGQAYSNRPSNIAWEKVCSPKQEGVYLKDGDWWEYQPNASASWYWRRICAARDQLKQVYSQNDLKNMTHYSVKQVYGKLTGDKPHIQWDKVVWNRLNVPKHSLLCLQGLTEWLGIQITGTSLQNVISSIKRKRFSKFRTQVWYAGVAALVYLIWKSRNQSFWEHSVPTRTMHPCQQYKLRFYFHKLPIFKNFRPKAASKGSKTVIADFVPVGIYPVENGAKLNDRLTLKQLLY